MVHRISVETGCAQPSRRSSTPQQSAVDIHQITFCFQAWHINNHPVSESAVSNRKMAEFIQGSLSGELASRWSVTTSPPLRPKPSLAAPVSFRFKRRPRVSTQSPKTPTVEDDRTAIVLEFVHFRDREYPILAKDYFNNNLRRRLDFHNVFAITTSGRRVEELERVVVSAKLNMRMAAALSTFGSTAWGDVSEGFTGQDFHRPATPEAPFKARLFLQRRYSDAWSVASDEVGTRPDSTHEVESIADEDETLVANEDEDDAEDEDKTKDKQQEDADDDQGWYNISEKEVHEACNENDNAVARRSTETETDEQLAIRNTLHYISPAFPFDFAWHILKPYMPLQNRLTTVVRYAKVIVSGGAQPYNIVLKNLNRIAIARRRPKAVRSYKLLRSSRTPQRAMSLGSFGVPASLALASAKWIMRQVKSMLKRVGKMMLRQDIH
ncbi:hypothetical protein VP1G_02794 [Cytospora mali]|uniref:Uncharacterized protein n=1 Tax=Cytospora mali TaxID=578113 RepID=A0A194UUT6_CYTMA|nr:hypothetical protein VP1G_02794 [Valsa mali var. pyri (nom. inval.)]